MIPAASIALGTGTQAAAAGGADHVAGLHAAVTAVPRPVAGTKPEWARPSAYRGAASGSAAISARIWLAGRDPAAEAAYARLVSTPGSREYRHFLTPARFRSRFGPTPAQRRAVISWARSVGLTVTSANDHYVAIKSTTAAAAHAFSVRFGEYSEHGTLASAPESNALVPAAVAPAVLTITGLDWVAHRDPALEPGQYTEYLPSSWNSVAACGGGGWYTEQTIDSEALHGIAPDASLVYVAAASCNDNDLETALLNIVDHHLADIVSNSWFGTEDQEAANIAAYDSIFQQAAVEGIGMYFCTGDAGYNDPNTPAGAGVGSDKLQVSYPAASPWVTAVGGTALAIGAAGNYEFETSYGDWRDGLSTSGTSWNDPLPGTYPADFYEGGGGGTAYLESQPWYQNGVVPASLSHTRPNGTTSSLLSMHAAARMHLAAKGTTGGAPGAKPGAPPVLLL